MMLYGGGGNTINTWDQMGINFISKCQEYYKNHEIQDEIFTITQNEEESLKDYFKIFIYILQRSKHKFDISTIITLFL